MIPELTNTNQTPVRTRNRPGASPIVTGKKNPPHQCKWSSYHYKPSSCWNKQLSQNFLSYMEEELNAEEQDVSEGKNCPLLDVHLINRKICKCCNSHSLVFLFLCSFACLISTATKKQNNSCSPFGVSIWSPHLEFSIRDLQLCQSLASPQLSL
jgi:hypothetical protein